MNLFAFALLSWIMWQTSCRAKVSFKPFNLRRETASHLKIKNATALNTLNCDGPNSVAVGLGKGKEVQQYFNS